jgi:hypothetical protein
MRSGQNLKAGNIWRIESLVFLKYSLFIILYSFFSGGFIKASGKLC